MINNQTKQLTPCELLGYKEGDKFRLINTTSKWTLIDDDGSEMPLFVDAEGVDSYLYLFEIEKIEETLQQTTELTFTEQQLKQSMENAGWYGSSFDEIIIELKTLVDPEYAEYLRLKAKFDG